MNERRQKKRKERKGRKGKRERVYVRVCVCVWEKARNVERKRIETSAK